MSKRINIILPDKTVAALDRLPTNRRGLIDRAVRYLVEIEKKANLRMSLKKEAIDNAARNLTIATEWYPLEEEAAKVSKASTRSGLRIVGGRKAARKPV